MWLTSVIDKQLDGQNLGNPGVKYICERVTNMKELLLSKY